MFIFSDRLSGTYLSEDRFDLGIGVRISVEGRQPVIGQCTAFPLKIIVSLLQCIDKLFISTDGLIGCGRQFVEVFVIRLRISDGHRFIGSPCGQHFNPEAVFANLSVIFERIGRIVGCSNNLDPHPSHNRLRAIFRCLQLSRTLFVYMTCIGKFQCLLNTEDTV